MAQFNLPLWQWLKRELSIWQIGAWPGLLVIGGVVVARGLGLLHPVEMTTLDLLLRSRPAEPIDERILIIGIDENDIRRVGTHPIPDGVLADLLEELERSQPVVIGLDIVRDLPVEPGHDQWVEQVLSMPNVVAIERILPDGQGWIVDSPPMLPPEQIGFVDSVLDNDGKLRRSLLGSGDQDGQFKLSFTIQLATQYLTTHGFELTNGDRDPNAMRFGNVEIPRFYGNAGGYVRQDAGGIQTLLHFRAGQQPFRMVSLSDIQDGRVPEDWIRDRIVLVGMVASSAGDFINSGAIPSRNPGLTYGVEIQAHAISQLVSATLDHRPLLQVWAAPWEYLWIIAWGLVGVGLGRLIPSIIRLLLALIGVLFILILICYGLLLTGWWVPLAPALAVVVINGAGLTASLFYLHARTLEIRVQERQSIIEQTFDAIHNGPLQTLAQILRTCQEPDRATDTPPPNLYQDLKTLNQELRDIYELIRQESQFGGRQLYLSGGLSLNLHDPTHELLYEIYHNTIDREFTHFKTLRIKLTTFDPIDNRLLTDEQKRGLCRFLEEAICNVGKHAAGATILQVECRVDGRHNILRVIDDGIGLDPDAGRASSRSGGRGTQQAHHIARQLGGQFRRRSRQPQGTLCELSWPITRPWFRRF
jgi:CHASE2 domain-containing sensor protein/two-component sensor histidine kinase